MMPSIDVVLKRATQQLAASGSDSPSLDAAVLLCHALNKPRAYLFTWPDKALNEDESAQFDALIALRVEGRPVAHITGEREFWSLPLQVSPTTLIPRPDTERLVEVALELSDIPAGQVLDLGTGTGAIALALASEWPQRSIIGVDLRIEAQQLAQHNAARLGFDNVTVKQGSWFTPLDDGTKFALIVSNPPYIEENDPHLEQGDVRFEPKSALVAREKGLADISYISEHARDYLLDGGWLVFEHGYDQGAAVRQQLATLGYHDVSTERDYGGQERVTLGRFLSK
ncbi:MAG: peptide chain release factor N(5)-glutamine methyltransferase [Vibrio sp.]